MENSVFDINRDEFCPIGGLVENSRISKSQGWCVQRQTRRAAKNTLGGANQQMPMPGRNRLPILLPHFWFVNERQAILSPADCPGNY
jgi:hypothetical protein